MTQLNDDIENLQFRLNVTKTTVRRENVSYIGQAPKSVKFCPVERCSQTGGIDMGTDTGVRIIEQSGKIRSFIFAYKLKLCQKTILALD